MMIRQNVPHWVHCNRNSVWVRPKRPIGLSGQTLGKTPLCDLPMVAVHDLVQGAWPERSTAPEPPLLDWSLPPVGLLPRTSPSYAHALFFLRRSKNAEIRPLPTILSAPVFPPLGCWFLALRRSFLLPISLLFLPVFILLPSHSFLPGEAGPLGWAVLLCTRSPRLLRHRLFFIRFADHPVIAGSPTRPCRGGLYIVVVRSNHRPRGKRVTWLWLLSHCLRASDRTGVFFYDLR